MSVSDGELDLAMHAFIEVARKDGDVREALRASIIAVRGKSFRPLWLKHFITDFSFASRTAPPAPAKRPSHLQVVHAIGDAP
jgi:hypothetical protein